MRIQHNIAALNAHRQLGNNNTAVSKNLEKLSSGYRINRAGDDAAGLAISEKMRAQITGLETASKNAQDGISLVQTAEGALTEVHSMLNRMVELADQSANGTYADKVDRENLQKELDSLKSEINRIADSTDFNGIKLLDGSMGMTEGAISVDNVAAVKAGALGEITAVRPGGAAVTATKASFTVDLSNLELKNTDETTAANAVVTIGDLTLTAAIATGTTVSGNALATSLLGNATQATVGGVQYNVTASGSKLIFEQAATPTADLSADKLDFSVSVTSAASIEQSGNPLSQVTNVKAGLAKKTPDLAEADIKLDLNSIGEGFSLKIGDDTYKFRFKGNETAYAGTNVVDVDLSRFEAGSTDAKNALVGALTAASTGNAKWVIGSGANAEQGKLTIRQKADQTAITDDAAVKSQISIGQSAAKDGGLKLTLDPSKFKVGTAVAIGDKVYEFSAAGEELVNSGAVRIDVAGLKDGSATTNDLASALSGALNQNGLTATVNSDNTVQITVAAGDTAPEVYGAGLRLQVGDTNDSFQKVSVKVGSMKTSSLGIDTATIGNQEDAAKAIDKIKNAINIVSSTRGDLGAIQNRLEHTINNLSVTTENMTAAESRIRDVDMAKEMMSYTKNNILVQASQAMLAQANQQPQGVLQLLQ